MTNQSKGIFRIGTSGIVVPGPRVDFPVEFRLSSRLNYYSSLFNTLEVNSTFKKIPRTSTLEKWALDVPESFQFTLKLSSDITHVKKPDINIEIIDTFLGVANHIGDKKGCLLIQFPGSITNNYYPQVEQILKRLYEQDEKNQWHKAVEFRSSTWYGSETNELLEKCGAIMVLHDMPKSKNLDLDTSGPFSYFRFHGPKGDYKGEYTEHFLQEQSEKIRHLLSAGKEVYTYFNNTMGCAFNNAMKLKEMVEK